MPYATTRDLPKAQTDQYSAHQKAIFRAAFNAAHASGKSESSAFAIAHAAAQRGLHPISKHLRGS